jgi:hypothetical protein
MQNLENEKLTWEASRLITNSLDKSEIGGTEGNHTDSTNVFS